MRKRMEEKGGERGKVSGSRVISPSQHRPLNSTPLVETKSDTRKAKLLQMHKPFSIHPLLSILSHTAASPFVSLSHPSFGVCNPLSILLVFRRLFRLLLLSVTHLYSVSQPFFIAKMSFCNSPFLFLFLLILPFHFLSVCLVVSLSLSLSFSSFHVSFKDVPLFLVFFFPPFLYIRETSLPDLLSITLFPIEHCPSHTLFLEEQLCSTSGYLTPLINSWHKSLRFGLFHRTRSSLEARKIEWSLSLFIILSWIRR